MFYSGVRKCELLALNLKDFDFEKNTVDINKSYVRFNDEDLIQTPKTPKSKRVITLPVQTMEIIKIMQANFMTIVLPIGYLPAQNIIYLTKW